MTDACDPALNARHAAARLATRRIPILLCCRPLGRCAGALRRMSELFQSLFANRAGARYDTECYVHA